MASDPRHQPRSSACSPATGRNRPEPVMPAHDRPLHSGQDRPAAADAPPGPSPRPVRPDDTSPSTSATSPCGTGPARPSTTSRSASRPAQVTAIIGPSGCGKSTFLRALNRMHELTPGHADRRARSASSARTSTAPAIDPAVVRRRVGMVFQKSNPFPTMSIAGERPGRPAPQRGARPGLPPAAAGGIAAHGRPLGRGQGPPRPARHQPFRRAAAAPVHRPGPGGRSRRSC